VKQANFDITFELQIRANSSERNGGTMGKYNLKRLLKGTTNQNELIAVIVKTSSGLY
jgi:hypothetical protein